MDELDRKILRLLSADGRMTVKDIARQVSLTSPAVSERIRRMERAGGFANEIEKRLNVHVGTSIL